MKIQTKLLVTFIVLGLASTGASGWQAFITARAALEAATFERLTSVRESRKGQIEQWFAQQRRILEDASEDATIVEGILALHGATGGAEHEAMTRRLDRALTRYTARHGFSTLLVAEARSGAVVHRTDGEEGRAVINILPAASSADPQRAQTQDSTGAAAAACALTDFAPAGGMDTPPVALLVAPVLRGDTAAAYIAAVIPVHQVNELMSSRRNWLGSGLGSSGETYIVGDDFRMRSDSRFFLQAPDRYLRHLQARGTDSALVRRIRSRASTVLLQDARTEASVAALRGETGSRITEDYRGIQVISSYTPLAIPGVRWVLLSEIDAQEAFRDITALKERLVLSGLGILVVGLIISAAVARSISRPVLKLARVTERFGSGRLDQRAEVNTRDEIGTLAATFNGMADRITKNTDALEAEIAERRNTEMQLTASRESLRNLSAHLQSVREDERKGVAREIHDELGQALTTLKLELRLLEGETTESLPGLVGRFATMTDLIDTTIRSMRRLISELRPRLLDDLGLTAAIEWQAGEFEKRTGITCRTRIHPPEFQIDTERSIAVFRIFQEALTNVARHAEASSVSVHLERDGTEILLEVLDNGRGISREEADGSASFGLLGIKERASVWGGIVTIDGAPGKGTRVCVSMPTANEAA